VEENQNMFRFNPRFNPQLLQLVIVTLPFLEVVAALSIGGVLVSHSTENRYRKINP
jgi:hypothetical protein